MSSRTTHDRVHPPMPPQAAPPQHSPRDPYEAGARPGATEPAPRLELSLSQVVGGSLAAATAAALGSRLGVVGTVSGAALASVVASVAASLYTAWLQRTRHRLSAALVGDRTVGRPARSPSTRRVLAGAAVLFVLAAVTVTGLELVTGRSLDGTAGGTTVAGTLSAADPGEGAARTRGGPDRGPAATSTDEQTSTDAVTPVPTPSSSPPTLPTAPGSTPGPDAGPDLGPTEDPLGQPSATPAPAEPTTTATAPVPGASVGPTKSP